MSESTLCVFSWGVCSARVPVPPKFLAKSHECRKPVKSDFPYDHDHTCHFCDEAYEPTPADGNASLTDFLDGGSRLI